MKKIWIAAVLVATFGAVTLQPPARALESDWTAGLPVVGRVTGQGAAAGSRPCVTEKVRVGNDAPAPLCVTPMNGWRYATYVRPNPPGSPLPSEHLFVIGIGGDTGMYAVRGMNTDVEMKTVPGTDTLIYTACCSAGHAGSVPFVVNGLPHKVTRTTGPTGVEYSVGGDARTPVNRVGGEEIYAKSVGVSADGRWAVVTAENVGIVRINLTDGSVLRMTDSLPPDEYGTSPTALTITDDGRTVFAGGMTPGGPYLDAYDVRSCGDTRGKGDELRQPCPRASLLASYDGHGYPSFLDVTGDGSRLTVASDLETVLLYPPGTVARTLSYLALGDSFASGEGDTLLGPDGYKYYAPYTDDDGRDGMPAEKCHQSTRSYPYLLGPVMGLTAGTARSVACSGAVIGDIIGTGPYGGQKDRLAGLSATDVDSAKAEALDLFIPGRVRQLDFVRRYAPLAATVGIGGNDVGFQPVLSMCAYPWPVTSCPYATDPTDRRNLGEAIRGAYPRLRNAYRDVLAASPGMRLYVTGYPRFVEPLAATCPFDVNLDVGERLLIDQGVRYMNAVIRAAALSAGADYVDVEDAFAGHMLCDSDEPYVNPIVLLLGREKSESFHPNYRGQRALASAVAGQTGGNLLAYDYCRGSHGPCENQTDPPPLPAYFGDSAVTPPFVAVPSELVALPSLLIGTLVNIRAAGLMPGSTVRLELHSSPTRLGEYAVGPEGTLDAPVRISGVAPGYHTLHAYGTSPSGEAVDMFQIVWVATGDERSDNDVPDTTISSTTSNRTDNRSGKTAEPVRPDTKAEEDRAVTDRPTAVKVDFLTPITSVMTRPPSLSADTAGKPTRTAAPTVPAAGFLPFAGIVASVTAAVITAMVIRTRRP